ncbi:hypothetical protein LMG18102_02056 [Ralstonia mannitolilytica]|uniref:hypothetical protein n=1 Tax=Ralstonia mannitolilytica TaxID=105219 RepID=UPI0028F68543|nr:hypothetical protein [Ralstonia mannitolilytica]CAJ0695063.1 hypothetical protein LMG18102_02056 [Ralstonia mannitolilytica]
MFPSFNLSGVVLVTGVLFLLGALSTILVALAGISASMRGNRIWQVAVVAVPLFALVQLMLLSAHRDIEDWYSNVLGSYYTSHPRSSVAFDGMQFPAGSTIVRDIYAPHQVLRGSVPAGTAILGTEIGGDFAMGWDGPDSEAPYVAEAILTAPAVIRGVPCAPGNFKQTIETSSTTRSLSCTLANVVTIDSVVVPAGANVTLTRGMGRDVVSGWVDHPWVASTVACAAGEFEYNGVFQCPLAHDQVFDGYPIRANDSVEIRFGRVDSSGDRGGNPRLVRGILAQPIDFAGVRIPAGTTIQSANAGPLITPAELRKAAWQGNGTVRFDLPEGAKTSIGDAVFSGSGIAVYVSNGTMIVRAPDDDNGSAKSGRYDLIHRTWCREDTCGEGTGL